MKFKQKTIFSKYYVLIPWNLLYHKWEYTVFIENELRKLFFMFQFPKQKLRMVLRTVLKNCFWQLFSKTCQTCPNSFSHLLMNLDYLLKIGIETKNHYHGHQSPLLYTFWFFFFLFCLKNDLMNQVHSYSYSLWFPHTKNTLIAQMVGYLDRDNRLLMWPLETLSGKNLLCKAVKNKSSLPYYTKAVALMVTRSLCAQGKESS